MFCACSRQKGPRGHWSASRLNTGHAVDNFFRIAPNLFEARPFKKKGIVLGAVKGRFSLQ